MIRFAVRRALPLIAALSALAPALARADDTAAVSSAHHGTPSVWFQARVKVAGGCVSLLGALRAGEAAKVHALAPDSRSDLTSLLAEQANKDVKVHVVPLARGLRVIGIEGRAGEHGAEVEDATYCWIIETLAKIPAHGTFEIRGTHKGQFARFYEVYVPSGGMEDGPHVGYVDVATAEVARRQTSPVPPSSSAGIVNGLRSP